MRAAGTAYRMALQTREQHIRREKATSNICTAQALLANIAAMYAVYHGPDGLRAIAERVHGLTRAVDAALQALGFRQTNRAYFDTLRIEGADVAKVRQAAEARGINFRYVGDAIGISLDETITADDVAVRSSQWYRVASSGRRAPDVTESSHSASRFAGRAPFLTHPVFNTHHSETQMMRYIKSLERKDVGLDTSMIPLGSCTMKLNAASEMIPVSWPEFSRMHPFAPASQTQGYADVFKELEAALCRDHGFCRGVAAAELRSPGRVCRPDDHPRLSSRSR